MGAEQVFLGLCAVIVAGGCLLELLQHLVRSCCEEHLDSAKLADGPRVWTTGLLEKSMLE